MVKFSGNDKETGRPLLGIALSQENCTRLLSGQPILFTTLNMDGLPAIDVFIMGGETDDANAEKLMEHGGMRPDQTRSDPALNDSQIHLPGKNGAH